MLSNFGVQYNVSDYENKIGCSWYELVFDTKYKHVSEKLNVMQVGTTINEDNKIILVKFYDEVDFINEPTFHIRDYLKILMNCDKLTIIEQNSKGEDIESKTFKIKLIDYDHKTLLTSIDSEDKYYTYISENIYTNMFNIYNIFTFEILDILKDGDENGN